MKRISFGIALLAIFCQTAVAATSVKDFRVQHSDRPLSVEDRHPVFSWRMESDERGQRQTAYQLSVRRDVDGSELWNTGKVESSQSVDIPYQGVALQAEKSYSVKLTVWDRNGQSYEASTCFETGIMNPRISAWGGADWIGVKQLKLDAASQAIFQIESDFRLVKGDVASFILGADDIRLKNSFLNDFGVQSAENYIKVDVDFAKQELRIFRVGYYKEDRFDVPFFTVSKASYPQSNLDEVFAAKAKSALHHIKITVEASNINFVLDGKDIVSTPPRARGFGGGGGFSVGMTGGARSAASNFTIGKLGSGGNYPSFPNLNSVGFAASPGSEVVYTGYSILNAGQSEDRVVFDSVHGPGYGIFEGKPGVTVRGGT